MTNIHLDSAVPRRRSIATPSRRRRIIYETARRIAKQYLQQGVQNHIDNEIENENRKYAAVRIQMLVRLYQSQKEFLRILHVKKTEDERIRAGTVLTNFSRKISAVRTVKCLRLQKQLQAEENRAAIKIQTFIRCELARRQLDELKLVRLHMDCAAIVIQSFVRSVFTKYTYISSRYRQQIEPSIYLVQRAYRTHLAVLRRRKMIRSSVILQSWWREMMMLSKLVIDDTSLIEDAKDSVHSLDSSPIVVEPIFEPEVEEMHISENESVVSLHTETASMLSYTESDTSISTQEGEVTQESSDSSDSETDIQILAATLSNSAIMIQRCFKAHFRRKTLCEASAIVANITLEAIERVAEEKWKETCVAAATKLQAMVRSFLGRKYVSKIDEIFLNDELSTGYFPPMTSCSILKQNCFDLII